MINQSSFIDQNGNVFSLPASYGAGFRIPFNTWMAQNPSSYLTMSQYAIYVQDPEPEPEPMLFVPWAWRLKPGEPDYWSRREPEIPRPTGPWSEREVELLECFLRSDIFDEDLPPTPEHIDPKLLIGDLSITSNTEDVQTEVEPLPQVEVVSSPQNHPEETPTGQIPSGRKLAARKSAGRKRTTNHADANVEFAETQARPAKRARAATKKPTKDSNKVVASENRPFKRSTRRIAPMGRGTPSTAASFVIRKPQIDTEYDTGDDTEDE